MTNIPFRWILISLVWLGGMLHSFAQNLVPNPSFESYTECPEFYNIGEPLQCAPWQQGNNGTSDYFNACSNPSIVGVPDNWMGYQEAHSGEAYAGGYWGAPSGAHEYLQVQLSCPLIEGLSYNISFYISLAELGCGIANFGVYFSAIPPIQDSLGWLNVIPQFESNLGYVSDYINWVLISGAYVAQGGEEWITIGNFYDANNTPIDPDCIVTEWYYFLSYYYVDDVSLTPNIPYSDLFLELGDPVITCLPYEIDSGVTEVEYHWSDGSTDPTLIVTQSGTYALTITSECHIGIDSVEVFFDGVPEGVDLGPPEVTICDGDSYTISLDPDIGDYQWQDGSTDPDYTITISGVYQVSFDDGCDVTTDEIMVFVMDEPSPFSLGGETYLCAGDEIEFTFDPNLGDFLWQDGSTSPDYTIDIGGIYALTISNICGEFSDEIEVIDILPPEIDLGPDELTFCEGEMMDIDLDPEIGDYLWQDGSTSSFYSISVSGIYAVTVSNACGTSSDEIEVIFGGEPIFDLGQNLVICPSQLPITLDIGDAINATSFLWQDGSTSSQFQVTGAGTYAVTVSNECFSIADQVEVLVQNGNPIVVLPPDQSLCSGETIMLEASGVFGNYLWQDSSMSSTLLVSQAGTYSLTITNQCGSGSDSITVNYFDILAVLDLGPDVTLCPGETFIFYTDVPGGNYTWQDSSTADSLVVILPGTYSLQIANMCSTTSDTVVVTFNDNPPVVDLPSSMYLCSADTVVIDAGISGVQYLWNDGTQLSSISVSDPGVYSITVSNACGADVDTVVIVDAGPPPSVSLNANLSICPGDVVLLSPVSSDVLSWLWPDGSMGSSYSVTDSGHVTVQVSNHCGIVVDTMLVSLLLSTPLLGLGADTSICPGEILTFSINIPGVDILWPDGSSGVEYQVTSAALVYATISNQCGSSFDSLDVIRLPPAPILDLGPDQSLCPGETIILSPDLAGVEYLWSDGSTSPSFNATTPGLIILTVANACGTNVDSIEILEDTDGPEVYLGEDVLACEGDVITISSNISGVDYLWQDGSTMSDYTTDISGTFILKVSNACGVDVDTVIVVISGNPPTPSLGPDTLLCEGFTFQLNSHADDETSIEWQDGSTLPVLNVSSPGTYILSESNHCGAASDTILITYESAPELFNLGPDTILCPGEFILLNAPVTTALITWQDGSHYLSIIADLEQTYSLQLSNLCGIASDDLFISIDERIPIVNIDHKIPWCPDDIITLDATQGFDASYQWNTGSTLPSIQVNTPGVYAVDVTTACQSLWQDIEVVPGEDCHSNIYIPSIFSPNGDDVNDVFSIFFGSHLDLVSLSCSIFDRWGNHVFHTNDLNFTWDGRFRNSELLPGVYVYHISLYYLVWGEQRNQVFSGDITLVR